jgi:GNAT superfamily N-acetyltransferase
MEEIQKLFNEKEIKERLLKDLQFKILFTKEEKEKYRNQLIKNDRLCIDQNKSNLPRDIQTFIDRFNESYDISSENYVDQLINNDDCILFIEIDKQNNICYSFILEKTTNTKYHAYIYTIPKYRKMDLTKIVINKCIDWIKMKDRFFRSIEIAIGLFNFDLIDYYKNLGFKPRTSFYILKVDPNKLNSNCDRVYFKNLDAYDDGKDYDKIFNYIKDLKNELNKNYPNGEKSYTKRNFDNELNSKIDYLDFKSINYIDDEIGFITINHRQSAKNIWDISYLYIKPEFRKKGFSKDAIYQIMKMTKEKNPRPAFITLNVRPDNIPAINLYKNIGFICQTITVEKTI